MQIEYAPELSAFPELTQDLLTEFDWWMQRFVNDIHSNIIAAQLNGDGFGTLTITSGKIKIDTTGYLETHSGLYFGDPDTNDTWRVTTDGNNLVHQRRESGSWVTKHTITP